jgi:hypothetical protein
MLLNFIFQTKQFAQISTATFASVATPAAPPAKVRNLKLTCHRCKCTISGPNATKEMDKHLKECGTIVCVLCNKKYKSMQTLHKHQLMIHANF